MLQKIFAAKPPVAGFDDVILIEPTMRIFVDTEFSGLVAGSKLISIGAISEDGDRTFYAELSDTWHATECNPFVLDAVIPHLEGGSSRMTMAELAERFGCWLASFDVPVQLAVDSLTWDWTWLQRIFELGRWPENVGDEPVLLTMNYLNDYDRFEDAVEAAFASGLRRHHALDDARALRLGWLAAGGDTMTFAHQDSKKAAKDLIF